MARNDELKVLVAWDGSPAAATAFPIARAVADQLSARVEVLHVHPLALSEVDFDKLAHQEWVDLTGVGLHVVVDEPSAGIIRAAEDPRNALVVLTTHGRTVEVGRKLGSVAQDVVIHARRPVLLVRPEAATELPVQPIKRLLLPLDGTPKTATALQPVTEFAAKLGASIDLLYVTNRARPSEEQGTITVPRYIDQAHHEWPSWAQEVVERLMVCCAACPPEVSLRVFLAHGDIGQEIASFAAAHRTNAIVLVRRSRLQSGRARILRAVLDLTPCPVLLVGGPEE